ncbi:uncharacterized protein LAJ45_10950 [Morchella importuna]|uniref:uncharacterized protein n=1 Tax=Morchella importuna TaxID=1174673 RepID=UPI001E8EBF97|nr:uncharacterized protein LAJ45_10950 [Morchella importuna]KAH8145039.1 hypothetical protein LAJ45_10950 [Morchella importuna]
MVMENSEPACVGESTASTFPCPYLVYYSKIGEIPHKDCFGKRFQTLKCITRHIQRIHIRQDRCDNCHLRLGYDMGRHKGGKYCKGKDREPEVPQKAINLLNDLKLSLRLKSFQGIKDVLFIDGQVVYDYHKEPLSSTEDEDLDEDAIDASLPEAVWVDGIWE